MNAIEKIDQVIRSGILIADLVVLPTEGATEDAIREEQVAMGRALSAAFLRFLRSRNGANLDVLVLFGCAGGHQEIPALRDRQKLVPPELPSATVIGSDPSGFVFAEGQGGEILSIDTQGAGQKVVAADFDDFICRLVFGEDSHLFAGSEWKEELREAGLVA